MKLLILGYSNIVQRRVLPAALSVFKSVEIASRRDPQSLNLSNAITKTYSNYSDALKQSDAEIVYVSGVNSEHSTWIEHALRSHRHVVVDKPAVTNPEQAEKLVNLAHSLSLCLAEATVYAYHPQIKRIQSEFDSRNSSPTRIISIFSVPPFASGNFRFKPELGGGALLDLGPYAISTGRLFFKEDPQFAMLRLNAAEAGTDRSFSVLLSYTGGRSLVGQYGFDTEYCNQIQILSPNLTVSVDRLYTPPADFKSTLILREKNKASNVLIQESDSFAQFLSAVKEGISSNRLGMFHANLLSDARTLDRLRVQLQKQMKESEV